MSLAMDEALELALRNLGLFRWRCFELTVGDTPAAALYAVRCNGRTNWTVMFGENPRFLVHLEREQVRELLAQRAAYLRGKKES